MKLANFEVAQQININNTNLFLNGAAIRTKFFIDTYIISLYLQKSTTNEHEVLTSTDAKVLRMQLITPLATPKAVSDNLRDGMKNGLGNLYYEHKDAIEAIQNAVIQSDVKYKDSIDIYSKADELCLYKENSLILTLSNSKIIADTIFNIYLGNPPKDKKIKQLLLKGF